MAQEYESLAARLGGATGGALAQGISGAADQLGGLISNRINELTQKRLQEEGRQKTQQFAEAMLPSTLMPEERQNLAQAISYGTPEERRDFFKMLGEAQQAKAFNRELRGGMPEESGGVEMLSQPQLPERVEQGALQGIQRVAEPFKPLVEQNRERQALFEQQRPQREEQQRLQQLDQETRSNWLGKGLESLGLGLGRLFGVDPNAAPEQKAQEIAKLDQQIEDVPIRQDLPPEERRKAAVEYMAMSNILNNPAFVAQPEQLNELGAISATINGKKASLMDYLADGGMTPENYMRLKQLEQKQDYEGRQWIQKRYFNALDDRDKAASILGAIDQTESLINSGAELGAGQYLLKSLGIDPIVFGNDKTQIYNKIINEFVAQSEEFNSGRGSNMKLGIIKNIKPDFWTKPAAVKAILEQFRYIAQLKQAKANIWDEEIAQRQKMGRPLDATVYAAIDKRLEPERQKYSKIMREKWRSLGVNIPEPTRISQEAYENENPAVVPLDKVPNGSRVRYKGKEFVVRNGKLTAPRGQ